MITTDASTEIAAAPVVWITGLAGAGKTTLAGVLVQRMEREGWLAVLIDGDRFRCIDGAKLGHAPADRHANAMRISRCAEFIAAQGVPVVVATMSLFHDIHDRNRAYIDDYCEVYLEASLPFLERRDSKGLYTTPRPDVVGLDLDFEAPRRPHLRFNVDMLPDPTDMVETIVTHLLDTTPSHCP